MLSDTIMDPNTTDIIDCVSVQLCVIASQSSQQPSVVTLPPCVKVEEVQLRAVGTLGRFTSSCAVRSNLEIIYYTEVLLCTNSGSNKENKKRD